MVLASEGVPFWRSTLDFGLAACGDLVGPGGAATPNPGHDCLPDGRHAETDSLGSLAAIRKARFLVPCEDRILLAMLESSFPGLR